MRGRGAAVRRRRWRNRRWGIRGRGGGVGGSVCEGSLKWEGGRIWRLVEDGHVMEDEERERKGDGVNGYQMLAGEGVVPVGAPGVGEEFEDPDTP
jgi:hypothetical protein